MTIKKEHIDAGETAFPTDSLIYAARLADSFEIHVDNKSEPYIQKLHMTLQLLSKVSEVKVAPKIDIVYKLQKWSFCNEVYKKLSSFRSSSIRKLISCLEYPLREGSLYYITVDKKNSMKLGKQNLNLTESSNFYLDNATSL